LCSSAPCWRGSSILPSSGCLRSSEPV
jgi:hypothetical protein